MRFIKGDTSNECMLINYEDVDDAGVKEKSNPFGRRGTQYARCNVTTLHFFQGNDYCHGAVLSFENYQILTSHWS